MLRNNWPVLVVDDEHDVLQITKMALKGLKFMNLPVEPLLFDNKADAIEAVGENSLKYGSYIGVALIDVVMETDEAGLELCNLVRGNLNNFFTRLYIRTGQPGRFSDSEVLEKYKVNGFLSKPEVTQEIIVKTVKSGLLDWLLLYNAQGQLSILNAMTRAATSRESLRGFLDNMIKYVHYDMQGKPGDVVHNNWGFAFEDELIGGGVFVDQEFMRKSKSELLALKPQFTEPNGGSYVRNDESNLHLFHLPAQDNYCDYSWLFRSELECPQELFLLTANAMQSYRNIWELTPK